MWKSEAEMHTHSHFNDWNSFSLQKDSRFAVYIWSIFPTYNTYLSAWTCGRSFFSVNLTCTTKYKLNQYLHLFFPSTWCAENENKQNNPTVLEVHFKMKNQILMHEPDSVLAYLIQAENATSETTKQNALN